MPSVYNIICMSCEKEFLSNPKRPKTRQKKYCSDECKNSGKSANMKDTFIRKYGVENPAKCKEVADKIRNTKEERYGSGTFNNHKKFVDTCIQRYGVSHPMELESTKDKIKDTNISRYGVENPSQDERVKNKKKETTLQHYGVENPFESEIIKLKIKEKLSESGIKFTSQKHYTSGVLEILESPENLSSYIKNKNYREVCADLEISYTTLLKYMKMHSLIDSTQSCFEQDVFTFISDIAGVEDLTQRTRKIIPPLELDIVDVKRKIAIECNGLYWHSELAGKDNTYHITKTERCLSAGFRLIHIYDFQWYGEKSKIVKSRLKSIFGYSNKIYARKCELRELSINDEINFFNNTHIQGYTPSSKCFGLYYKDEIVCAMSFIKSRFNKNYEWELLRYSSALDVTVIGGASRLLSYFIKDINPTSMISYSLRDWGEGDLYTKLGFDFLHNSSPNYWYTKDNFQVESRIKYQKHKLPKILDNFDEKLTEWENMKNNGFDRYWDSGNKVFTRHF